MSEPSHPASGSSALVEETKPQPAGTDGTESGIANNESGLRDGTANMMEGGGDFELFSTRKPKDLAAGTSSGIKSLCKGVFGGVSSLIVAPVLGAQQNGVAGFCQGLAQGVMGAIALPIAGAAVATLQVGRGLVNTAEAVMEQNNGKGASIA